MGLKETTRRALLGAACGDAFGAPFEYHKHAYDLARQSLHEQRYLEIGDVKVSPDRARVPGMWTDDTQQSRILIMAREDGLGPSMAREFFYSTSLKMLKSGGSPHGTHRGTGSNFREAIQKGQALETAGLGASMRVAPVATLFDDPNEMVLWLTDVSTVTTYHPVSIACAIKVALAAWVLSHPGDRDRIKGLKYPDAIRDCHNTPPAWYGFFTPEVWRDTVRALQAAKESEGALLAFGSTCAWTNRPLFGVADGFALTGFAWAIASAFTATSFEAAMDMAASPGGDTDTICAITGALAALRFDIPRWMLEGLVDDPTTNMEGFKEFNRQEYLMTREEMKLRASLVKTKKS